jgi:hypothetical protein
MSKTIITKDKVTETGVKPAKVRKIPNFWVELVSFLLLVVIAISLGYLIVNYNSIVEFRELT